MKKLVDVQVHETSIEDNKGIKDNKCENQTVGVTSDVHEGDEEVHQTEGIEDNKCENKTAGMTSDVCEDDVQVYQTEGIDGGNEVAVEKDNKQEPEVEHEPLHDVLIGGAKKNHVNGLEEKKRKEMYVNFIKLSFNYCN